MNLSVLVHTFDGYKHLWPGFIKSFTDHWPISNCDIPLLFGTDVPCDFSSVLPFNVYYSGSGEWSDRLKRLLAEVVTDYVLYIQEDFYLKEFPPNIEYMTEQMQKQGILRYQISPIVQFYSLTGSELPLFFHPTSKYLVSHQPSIWRKDFLLSCLEPGESPWVNEYEGTKRLQKRDIKGKIAIYPYDWYSHKCIRGKVQD